MSLSSATASSSLGIAMPVSWPIDSHNITTSSVATLPLAPEQKGSPLTHLPRHQTAGHRLAKQHKHLLTPWPGYHENGTPNDPAHIDQ